MREATGLSQQRLATLADCSPAAVCLFESGYRPPRSKVLPRVIRVLNDRTPAGNPGFGETIFGVGIAGHVGSG